MKSALIAISLGACLCAVLPCSGKQQPVQVATATEMANDTTILKTDAHVVHKTNISILAGYSQGVYGFGELGVAVNKRRRAGNHSTAMVAYASSEVKIDKQTIIGPKIGGWISGGAAAMALGANFIYYSDFSSAAWCFRPECGLGILNWKVVYGYNFLFTNKQFEGVNSHVVSFVFLFGLKK